MQFHLKGLLRNNPEHAGAPFITKNARMKIIALKLNGLFNIFNIPDIDFIISDNNFHGLMEKPIFTRLITCILVTTRSLMMWCEHNFGYPMRKPILNLDWGNVYNIS